MVNPITQPRQTEKREKMSKLFYHPEIPTPRSPNVVSHTYTPTEWLSLPHSPHNMLSGAQRKKQRNTTKVPPTDCLVATTEPMERATALAALDEEEVEMRKRGFISQQESVYMEMLEGSAWGGFIYTFGAFDWPTPQGVVYTQLMELYTKRH